MEKESFIEVGLKNKVIALCFAVLLIIAGLYALFNMARNEFPEFTVRQGLIIGYYPGANSKEVEQQLTKKVEEYLFGFKEVDKSRTYSYSKDGMMYIYVEINENVGKLETEDFWNKIKHGTLLLQHQLPEGVLGIVVNSDFGNTSAVVLAVQSKDRSYKELEIYVKSIQDQIRKIPVLSKISYSGDFKEQIGVYVDNNKLALYGLNAAAVMQAIKYQGTIGVLGKVKGNTIDRPIYVDEYYNTESDLAKLIIRSDQKGNVIRLKDIAQIKREYQDPDSYVTTNGTKCLVISMEMQTGKNIVQFGKTLDEHLDKIRQHLPADIKLTKVANQPAVVDESITHFMREFGISLVAVIIVTLLLLPLRIAGVAGATIPLTILSTLGVMYMLGIELDTVTLAALIIVLGIVVDDPIVVIDNHVEKLDHGYSVWDAAVSSAKELFPSVFTATLAISATFAPLMIFLSGTPKDFISIFPVTVIIALTLSLIISMLLVPYFNTVLIKSGLLKPGEKKETKEKKKSLLDRLQNFYNNRLEEAFKHDRITLAISFIAVIIGAILIGSASQQLFPKVERNQFAIEVYLPTGNNLKSTATVVKQVEKKLAGDKRVISYTSFIGSSSPRFHTVYAPNLPSPNYAQILVNTVDEDGTQEILTEYQHNFSNSIPNAYIRMKQLNMINVLAPIEVRISGDSIADLKLVSAKVEAIASGVKDVMWIRTDYEEMNQGYQLKIKRDEAGRLGFTRKDLSDALAMNFQGITATKVWEGDYDIDVDVKTAADQRNKISDIRDQYIASPLTHSIVPIRQIADLSQGWTEGQVTHRNGVRTITVRMDTQIDVIPEDVLERMEKQINALALPPGVTIAYGGERAEMIKNMGPMGMSLFVSVILIFFILLFHFKGLKYAALSIVTMPLSLFGAGFGLFVTGYPFGFTAFIGLLSLCGIVVRNGIILIDFAGEMRRQEGMSVMQAAIHSGERRMRPIFLTSSAAAVGVIPMILSKSSLWGPLGTVICFGLLFSMALTLFAMPVMYWILFRKEDEVKQIETEIIKA
ncbi:efflux RND transporter permease subunit [Mucilaginibacter sp. McL0603]|uniref:efflux RND transporter permease subunit n=1 Tax=Mucilaginibacter sp. McL0603 TaxID=3415670 RepID=UPI003CEC3DB7